MCGHSSASQGLHLVSGETFGWRICEIRRTFAGAGTNKTILALRAQGRQVGERSMLIVESRREILSIRALHLHNADLVLTFPESKAERGPVAKAPEAMQSVPILVTAN